MVSQEAGTQQSACNRGQQTSESGARTMQREQTSPVNRAQWYFKKMKVPWSSMEPMAPVGLS